MRITIDKNFQDNTPCPKLDYISETILSQLLKPKADGHEPPEHWMDALSNCNWNFSDKNPEYGAIFVKKFTMPDSVFHWSLLIIAHADTEPDGYRLRCLTFTLPDGSEKKVVPTPLQCLYTEARFASPQQPDNEFEEPDTDEDPPLRQAFSNDDTIPSYIPLFFRNADEVTRYLKVTDTVIEHTFIFLLQSITEEAQEPPTQKYITFSSPLISEYQMFLSNDNRPAFTHARPYMDTIQYDKFPISLKIEMLKEITYNTINAI